MSLVCVFVVILVVLMSVFGVAEFWDWSCLLSCLLVSFLSGCWVVTCWECCVRMWGVSVMCVIVVFHFFVSPILVDHPCFSLFLISFLFLSL